jgi:UDP-N-acetyl-D-galactosamine dehydrogenase
MGAFVADAAIKQMIEAGKAPKNAKVIIFGITFKENCPDTRNSKVSDIIKRLEEYEIVPQVTDPCPADRKIANNRCMTDLQILFNLFHGFTFSPQSLNLVCKRRTIIL